ncbi:MAG: TIM44-like domain-containing protein [Planctomycetota bacterium]
MQVRFVGELKNRWMAAGRALWVGAALLLCLLSSSALWARAGGGGGYSSGSDGGGGGGDGIGEVAVWIIFELVRFAIYRPVLGVPLLIVVGIGIYYAHKQGFGAYRGSVIRRGGNARVGNRRQRAQELFAESDPEFDPDRFEERATIAFRKIQKAWSEQELEPIRAFVSDGIFERFSLQVEEQRAAGYRNRMDHLSVRSVTVVDVTSDRHFDTLTVRFRAAALDTFESLSTGERLSESSIIDEPFCEYWSFLRRRGTKTVARGLIEGSCPNCGSSIELNRSARCDSCDSLLRSGEFDWVLAEITQASVWRARRNDDVDGYDEYQRKDPDFNLQHIEDRCSVMFWRWQLADRTGDVEPLSKIASDEYCRAFMETRGKGAERDVFVDCAVGAVEMRGVLPGTDVDQVIVEIRWSGQRLSVGDLSSYSTPRSGDRPKRTTLFVLERKAGTKTELGESVSSAHCSACGAPESRGADHSCNYCGEVLNDGTHDWVLVETPKYYSQSGRAYIERLRKEVSVPILGAKAAPGAGARPRRAEVLAWAARVAKADGSVEEKERQSISKLSKKCDLSGRDLRHWLSSQANDEIGPEPASMDEAREWISELIDVALADGKVTGSELTTISQVGERQGFSMADVRMLVKKRQNQLYKEAKRELKEKRRRRQRSGD